MLNKKNKILTTKKKCTFGIQCFGGMLENLLMKLHLLALKPVVLSYCMCYGSNFIGSYMFF